MLLPKFVAHIFTPLLQRLFQNYIPTIFVTS